ncbi:MAG TPA: CRISPR system precrRNA processing endoribonuclease RAMP protein Cas6 [Bacilli bacterium]|nr:CRISPR system precrRNA processing endoribonuclease RAMP protein Cas6 [Bacilli bacterium]
MKIINEELGVNGLLQDLRIARYRFVLEAGEQGLDLPPFKSSAFRGGFGHVFKSLTCKHPGVECGACEIQHSCPYVYVFETKPPADSKVLKNFENVPRPYVIVTRFDDQKMRFSPGERLSFELMVFGDAIEYAPFFIYSFDRLGDVGIGKQRRPYRLVRVEALDQVNGLAFEVYDGKSRRIRQHDYTLNGSDLEARAAKVKGADGVTVSFETPLRMKSKGSYTSDPQFHLLVRNAVRRVTSLLYFHHGGKELSMDYASFFKRAEAIELVENKTRWVDWDRYSARQDKKMSFGGLVGEAEYRGDISEFVPWLLAAEELHMAKQTAFGLGKIRAVYTV